MNTRRVALIAAGTAAVVGLVLTLSVLWSAFQPGKPPAAMVGGPFSLTDQNGRTVTDATFKGAPFLVFFGYTHCPDVCPTTLSDMSQMLAALGKDRKAQAVFITVDPEQDTQAVLKDYMSAFDPRILALTGTPEAINAVEKAYRVYAKKVPSQDGSYSMDHTAIIYLMDKEGGFTGAFNLQQAPDKAAADFVAVM